MKKNFTFILLSLLLFVVGGAKSQTTLPLKGGYNWEATDGTNNWSQNDDASYTSGTVHLKDNAWGETNNIMNSALGGTHWAATFNTGETHTFTVTLDAESAENLDLHIVAVDAENNSQKLGGSFSAIAVNNINTTSTKTLTLEVTDAYYAVYLYSTSSGAYQKYYKITSITRTVTGGAPSVNAPTISPASGTYDGDLSVTITPGEGNDHVKFTVTGNTDGTTYTNESITSATTINLTGTSTITVTATGYDDGDNASSEVTNTYTYSIPSGQSSTTSGLPHTFNSWDSGNSIEVSNAVFSSIETGDYVVLDVANVAQNGTVLGFRETDGDWHEAPYSGCTTTSGGNGAKGVLNIGDTQWWMKVNSDVVDYLKNHHIRMQGGMVPMETAGTEKDVKSSVDLTSIKVYKSKGVSESLDNSLTKINHVVVELTRSFVADTWNTVCLPFKPTADQANALFGSGYTIAEFTGVNGTTLEFTTFGIGDFVAGQPYLVKPTADLSNISPVVLFDVDITAKNGATVPHGGYSFTGTFTTKSFAEGERATTRFVAANNKLNTPDDSGNAMKALRCYFTVPAESPARGYAIDGFMDDDVTTDISATLNDNVQTTKVIYNLAGQRVANPTKGLYIVNGQKVVVK